jgi:hypothetical protein
LATQLSGEAFNAKDYRVVAGLQVRPLQNGTL